MTRVPAIVLFMMVTFFAFTAQADDYNPFKPGDIRLLFVVKKNTNRNEVAYGIHLDKSCQPVGDEPIYPYWRQLERGPDAVDELTFLDRTVYGIGSQKILKKTPEESKVLMTLKATSDRGIAIITKMSEGKCVAKSITFINGLPGLLDNVFVHVAGVMSVDWIEIRGTIDGKDAVERIKH